MKKLIIYFKSFIIKIVVAFFIISTTVSVLAETVKGKIIRVVDGDTVLARTVDNKKIRIRLSGIDAPEKKQAYGIESKKFLENLISSKIVKISISKKDKYKRYLGMIFLNKTNINLELVKSGNAWAYRRYLKKMNKKLKEAFIKAESHAQFQKIGLWGKKSPVPPWLWRKKNK